MEDKQEEKKIEQPTVYLMIDKNNKVVAYSSVNISLPVLVRETEDKTLFDKMKQHGAFAIVDSDVNYIVGLGLTGDLNG